MQGQGSKKLANNSKCHYCHMKGLGFRILANDCYKCHSVIIVICRDKVPEFWQIILCSILLICMTRYQNSNNSKCHYYHMQGLGSRILASVISVICNDKFSEFCQKILSVILFKWNDLVIGYWHTCKCHYYHMSFLSVIISSKATL